MSTRAFVNHRGFIHYQADVDLTHKLTREEAERLRDDLNNLLENWPVETRPDESRSASSMRPMRDPYRKPQPEGTT